MLWFADIMQVIAPNDLSSSESQSSPMRRNKWLFVLPVRIACIRRLTGTWAVPPPPLNFFWALFATSANTWTHWKDITRRSSIWSRKVRHKRLYCALCKQRCHSEWTASLLSWSARGRCSKPSTWTTTAFLTRTNFVSVLRNWTFSLMMFRCWRYSLTLTWIMMGKTTHHYGSFPMLIISTISIDMSSGRTSQIMRWFRTLGEALQSFRRWSLHLRNRTAIFTPSKDIRTTLKPRSNSRGLLTSLPSFLLFSSVLSLSDHELSFFRSSFIRYSLI